MTCLHAPNPPTDFPRQCGAWSASSAPDGRQPPFAHLELVYTCGRVDVGSGDLSAGTLCSPQHCLGSVLPAEHVCDPPITKTAAAVAAGPDSAQSRDLFKLGTCGRLLTWPSCCRAGDRSCWLAMSASGSRGSCATGLGLLNQLVARCVLGLPVRQSAVVPDSSGGRVSVTWQDLENDGREWQDMENDGLAYISQPGTSYLCFCHFKPYGNADDCSLHAVSVCKTAICVGCYFGHSSCNIGLMCKTSAKGPATSLPAPCAMTWPGSLILSQADSSTDCMVCTCCDRWL